MQERTFTTTTLGYPRVGQGRAYKWMLEDFWAGKTDQETLQTQARQRENECWQIQREAGIDHISVGDFSLYDHVLDTSIMLGCIPERYGWDCGEITPQLYFAMARGANGVPACEMTKWFDTNYHYMVPELPAQFQLTENRPLAALRRAKEILGIAAKPWLLGPFTFLRLAGLSGAELISRLQELTPLYERILSELAAESTFDDHSTTFPERSRRDEDASTPLSDRTSSLCDSAKSTFVQIDEPSLVGDVSDREWNAFAACYETLAKAHPALCVQTYYGDVAPLWERLVQLPVAALGVDLVAGRERNRAAILGIGASETADANAKRDVILKGATRPEGSPGLSTDSVETSGDPSAPLVPRSAQDDVEKAGAIQRTTFPADKKLVLGIVDGRNVWRSDLDAALKLVQEIAAVIPAENLLLSPSCSLLHLPETVASEEKLPEELRGGLCFAQERLAELALLSKVLLNGIDSEKVAWNEAKELRDRWLHMEGRNVSAVRDRVDHLQEKDFQRAPLAERRELQKQRLPLPVLPTTTIGSFPQTKELRAARAHASKDPAAYQIAIREEIARVVQLQEEIGLDVLVHGEAERNDMVQFFGEQLHGYAATAQGWVQSYGSRCVRPPLIFGDVWREKAMTVKIAKFAQTLTAKPMKGMLTGPVTMLQWSFVRDDLPRRDVAYQIALAIRDEVVELENADLKIIQIDEAAFREGLPIRRADWDAYLEWAVNAFRLTSSGVAPQTQIHTHMCYSDFGDIIAAIAAMDADVISIEDARSHGEMLKTLRDFQYPAAIGPGVYDIHSPNVPDAETMATKIRQTLEILPVEQVWVNPDCGLKTRGYKETIPALQHMVEAAKEVRESL